MTTAQNAACARGVNTEPYYLPLADEAEVFKTAYEARLPVLLKGPTGCGKTRFVEHMTWHLFGNKTPEDKHQADHVPLITISCHEDLSATDLVGRYLLQGDQTVWMDGPLTRAVRTGALCYLDEVVEARKDTTVLIHSLTDHRRLLPIDKTNELLAAHPDFLLIMSYNPGYQSVLKDLKPSTRQRFVSLELRYPNPAQETAIIAHETGIDATDAEHIAVIGQRIRNLSHHGFEEGVSTRLLVYTAALINRGIAPRRAAHAAIVTAVSDDTTVQQAIADIIDVVLP